MERTRIFISSSSQRELQELRLTTYQTLKDIGHEPVMWEKSFGPWPNSPSVTTIDKCLDEVATSDLYLLFISDKAGTYIEWDDSSVTHLELRKACEMKMEIVVFVDKKVSEPFLGKVKRKIDYALRMEAEKTGVAPELLSVYELVKEMNDLPPEIEPYTWVILYDCYVKNVFMEALNPGVDIQWRIKEYLSSKMKRGLALLPAAKRVEKNEEDAKEYIIFRDLSRNLLLSHRRENWRGFLSHLLNTLRRAGGGEIVFGVGTYRRESLGKFSPCSGISLYKRDGDKMVRVEYEGLAEGPEFYMMDELDSFVVQACLAPDDFKIFYREDKQTVYLTVLSATAYVLCFHFELEEKWSEQRVQTFLKQLFDGILLSHSNRNFIMHAQLILGGDRR